MASIEEKRKELIDSVLNETEMSDDDAQKLVDLALEKAISSRAYEQEEQIKLNR